MMLDYLKSYLRVDGVDEDPLLDSLIIAAIEFIYNGTGIKFKEVPGEIVGSFELYKLSVAMLVSHWSENREPVGSAKLLSYSMESIFIQLKYCYENEVI